MAQADIIQSGTNITVTGTGSNTDPYIINAAGGGAEIPIQDDAPSSPDTGDLWVDSDAECATGTGGSNWIQVVEEPGTALTNWTSESGTWSIADSAIQAVGLGVLRLNYQTFPLTELCIQYDWRITASTGSDSAAYFQVSAASGTPVVRLGTDTSNRVYRIERQAQATIAGPTQFAAGAGYGTWAAFRSHYTDGALSWWHDGTYIDSAMVGAISDLSGLRLATYTNGTITAQFRNIKVWRPALPWE